jgi:hypothetical protein
MVLSSLKGVLLLVLASIYKMPTAHRDLHQEETAEFLTGSHTFLGVQLLFLTP